MADEIILHHYDTSPFSEKVRVMLGVKGLSWRSVIQPVIMPKPELVPLTGGYRRIPVLQIGADVYCDTQCIMAEIERRHARPPVSGIRSGLGMMLGWITERQANPLSPNISRIFSENGEVS